MAIKIGVDSCCDLEKKLTGSVSVTRIPLTIDFDGTTYIDDENLDMQKYIEHMRRIKSFKTSMPSVQAFLDFYEQGDEDIFFVTMSHTISGTHDNAKLAANMYHEKHGQNKKITVINSHGASSKIYGVAREIIRLHDQGKNYEEIHQGALKYVDTAVYYMMLESLENLAKSGRCSPEVAKEGAANNLRLILTFTENGLVTLEKCFGTKNALRTMAKLIAKRGAQTADSTVYISHCQAASNAEFLISQLQDSCQYKDVIVQNMGGIPTIYADLGGIIVTV